MPRNRALLGLFLLSLTGCVTDDPSGRRSDRQEAKPVDASAWVQPSEALGRRIERHVDNVRRGRDLETFAREAEWFVSVGEVAYPQLLELAAAEDVRLASFGLATISAVADPRLLEPLRDEVPFPADQRLRYEYARALVAMGDWSQLGTIIDGLEAELVTTRGAALKTLRQATGETFGFHPQGLPEERAAAVVRWREWWQARSADPLLSNGGAAQRP